MTSSPRAIGVVTACWSSAVQFRRVNWLDADAHWFSPHARPVDLTPNCVWFLGCLGRAADASNLVVERVLRRARFWSQAAAAQVNPRQRKALTRLLEGFVGDMTSGKYANPTRCSHDTAGRDLEALAKLGLLKANGKKGRRAGYQLP